MKTSTWKAAERRIAEMIGGVRVPVSGRHTRGHQPDIEHDRFSIEVKHRKTLPAWLHDAMDQAVKSKRGCQLPLVVLHSKNQRYEDSFCVVRLKDIQEMEDGSG